jgi:periplasmic protein TonB
MNRARTAGRSLGVSRSVDALALAASALVHGATLAGALAIAGHDPIRPATTLIVDLISPALETRPLEPPRPVPPRATAVRPSTPPRPLPITPPPRAEAPAEPREAPVPQPVERPAPEIRVDSPPPTLAEAPRPAESAPAFSASTVEAAAERPPATAPTARWSGSTESAPTAKPPAARETPPGPSVAALPPSSTSTGAITQEARPRGGYQVRPAYPSAARLAKAEGTSLLRVHVTADGRIGEVQVQRSAGHPALDEAAVAAVRKWRFEPARNGATAVAVWVVIPFEFELKRDF